MSLDALVGTWEDGTTAALETTPPPLQLSGGHQDELCAAYAARWHQAH